MADSENPEVQDQDNEDNTQAGSESQENKQPTIEELLNSEAVQRRIQSEADKRLARHLEKERQDRLREAARRSRAAEAEYEDDLIKKGDFETLGKTAAEKRAEAEIRGRAINEVAGAIERAFKQHPELVKDLGEDQLEELWQETYRENGDVVDYIHKLMGARQTRAVQREVEKLKKELEEEYEAKLKEAGVEVRSKEVEEGKAPAEEIARGAGGRGITDKQLIKKAAAGEDVDMKALEAALKREGVSF